MLPYVSRSGADDGLYGEELLPGAYGGEPARNGSDGGTVADDVTGELLKGALDVGPAKDEDGPAKDDCGGPPNRLLVDPGCDDAVLTDRAGADAAGVCGVNVGCRTGCVVFDSSTLLFSNTSSWFRGGIL